MLLKMVLKNLKIGYSFNQYSKNIRKKIKTISIFYLNFLIKYNLRTKIFKFNFEHFKQNHIINNVLFI